MPTVDDEMTEQEKKLIGDFMFCNMFPSKTIKFNPLVEWIDFKYTTMEARKTMSKLFPALDDSLREGKVVLKFKMVYEHKPPEVL